MKRQPRRYGPSTDSESALHLLAGFCGGIVIAIFGIIAFIDPVKTGATHRAGSICLIFLGLTTSLHSIYSATRNAGLYSRIWAISDEPWLAVSSWQKFESDPVDTYSRTEMLFLVPVSISSGGAVAWIFANWPWAFGIAFLAVTAGVLLAKRRRIYRTLQQRKWTRTILVLEQLPLPPGETLTGTIYCGRRVHPDGSFQITLTCSADRVVYNENASTLVRWAYYLSAMGAALGRIYHTRPYEPMSIYSTVRTDFYSQLLIVPSKTVKYGRKIQTAIPVSFVIPHGFPGTSVEGKDHVYWQLEIWGGDIPGIDFGAVFDLPVYQVKDDTRIRIRQA